MSVASSIPASFFKAFKSAAADAPSKEEVFGLTTVEALACGTPAIVYKNTACEEIALQYGGVAVEQSVLVIKNMIKEICKDSN